MKTLKSVQGFLQRQKKILLLIMFLIVITIMLVVILYVWLYEDGNRTIHSIGILRTTGVRVYGGDLTTCDGEEYCINWSTIYLGISTNRSFYVQSESNVNATLKFEYGNWIFEDSNNRVITDNQTVTDLSTCMSIECPQDGLTIQPNEIIYATLILSPISSPDFIEDIIINDVQTFSFDTHIYTLD